MAEEGSGYFTKADHQITMLPSLIARQWIGRQTLGWSRLKVIPFSWLGPELLVCCLTLRGSTGVFRLLQIFSDVVWRPETSFAGQLILFMNPRVLFIMVFIVIHLCFFP